ncbi:MAG: malic enzyme-like NAD(P)-binding protein [Bacteroidota bacterium]
MKQLNSTLDNLDEVIPDSFTADEKSKCKTLFLKKLSLDAHNFYQGKIQTLPKAPVIGTNWFNVWYTPGVSAVSTAIRDDHNQSFALSNRSNLVAVVSDSTRVLGDGDCTPAGGLGVMEGKAYLMKYLGGVDAVALCIDSKDKNGENDPQKIIDFVKMCQYSFGAINLEDISQPNCYKVLDVLRQECSIPVWHDDAQGTACVTLAGIINALILAEKEISTAKIILYGAGAANSTIARLLITEGAKPENIIIFDKDGSLHNQRKDYQNDERYYPIWKLCQITNPLGITSIEEAFTNADILIALSAPGPNTIKPDWIRRMNTKAIVFVCANPVPEIYPHAAIEAGAYIVATGRGDFPNQVNNSIGFPGILKGALMVRASKITDSMAIAAAHALAKFAQHRGIDPNNIVPTMEEANVFPYVAAKVAMQAIADGVARINISYDQVFETAQNDISNARVATQTLIDNGLINLPPQQMIDSALDWAINNINL